MIQARILGPMIGSNLLNQGGAIRSVIDADG